LSRYPSHARRSAPIGSTRPGGHTGFVGRQPVELSGAELFRSQVHLHGGAAPVRHFLPELIGLNWDWKIDSGKMDDLELLFDQAADGHRAMDERRAINALLRP
jgi:threonine dehydrogenase-like Zn-dependent dehydrogenase